MIIFRFSSLHLQVDSVYLLRATTDDLYLVHDRQVAPFDGDLNDYYKWLTEQQKAERKEQQASAPEKSTDNSAAARKEQKRKEAEFRKNLTKLEQKMDKLGQILSDTETQLSDTELYQAEIRLSLTKYCRSKPPRNPSLKKLKWNGWQSRKLLSRWNWR
jgi:ATP-binding cassette subfamily F protein 3